MTTGDGMACRAFLNRRRASSRDRILFGSKTWNSGLAPGKTRSNRRRWSALLASTANFFETHIMSTPAALSRASLPPPVTKSSVSVTPKAMRARFLFATFVITSRSRLGET